MCSASKVILGIKNKSNGKYSASVAKYCSKRLRSDCTVVALNNGKKIFEKEVTGGSRRLPNSSKFGSRLSDDTVRPQWYCLIPIKSRKEWENVASVGKKDWCSSKSYETDSPQLSASKGEESLEIHVVERYEDLMSCSNTIVAKETHEVCLSWPSLRRICSRKSVSFHENKSRPAKLAMHIHKRNLSVDFSAKPKWFPQTSTLTFEGDSKAIESTQTDIVPSPFAPINVDRKLPEELVAIWDKKLSVCRLFEYIELQQATSNFSEEKIIGKGGSSIVYKGYLPDGQELAVKILKQTERMLEEFVAEIETLSTLQHKNIISLVGFCLDCTNLILVYDYIPMGSLDDVLHGKNASKHDFSWSKRYKVAVGITKALNYLHGYGSKEPVIHMDMKPSNILLSNNFEPQLCDFGLSRVASKVTLEQTCANVAGTFGYLAPEYFLNGDVNEKVDVYALGVVLLELISGRRPITCGPKGQENLVTWAKPIIEARNVKELIDPTLGNEYDKKEVEQLILAACLCTRRISQDRPEAKLVLKLLQGDDDSIKWARMEFDYVKLHVALDNEISIPDSAPNIETHINALFDIEDDLPSINGADTSIDSLSANTSIEEYLHWRWNQTFSSD